MTVLIPPCYCHNLLRSRATLEFASWFHVDLVAVTAKWRALVHPVNVTDHQDTLRAKFSEVGSVGQVWAR